MPSEEPISLIQNTFAAGEISPALFGRTDLAKFHQSAAIMRNFYVDYKGGATSRPGTQFIGEGETAGHIRLIPFQFSASIGQTYMLVFSPLALRFIKNPGTLPYPNSSNAGFILNAGVPYTIATPYTAADLPLLKFSQIADQMTIVRHGHPRYILSRISDTNWTLTAVSTAPAITAPVLNAITISALPAGSPDPQNTKYQYAVTAVNANGVESLASNRIIGGPGINIATTQGTVSLFWSPVAGAVYYKIYKGLPTPGAKTPSFAEQLGFIGYSYGTQFTDSNIVADYTASPPLTDDPFIPGRITGYAIAASSADWPVDIGTTLAVADGTGTGAVLAPAFSDNTNGGVGSITGIIILNSGTNYTAPTVTAVGPGTIFTATLSISPRTGIDPNVVALFQQRQIYASTINFPNTLWGSRPGQFNDFRTSNPVSDGDAYTFTIASPQVNDILWMVSMPGGLVVATNTGIVQLTGGSSSATNPTAVTPTNAVIVPQSYYGSADLAPIVINYDILYVQSEQSIVRDLQYNFFVNIYTGTDISALSSHLFYPHQIISWAYQDSPRKVVWAVREDGMLLSLTFLKEQEILGWARHDTNGVVIDVAVVREGSTDAVYMVVQRSGNIYVERLCDNIFNSIEDSWCVDSALSTVANWKLVTMNVSGSVGPNVLFTAGAAVFAPGDVGTKVMRTKSGARATITQYISTTQVRGTISSDLNPWELSLDSSGMWRLDPIVSSVSGLGHLAGQSVMALVDGKVQGPFTVSGGGVVNLTTPGSSIVIGLGFPCQLQTLYLDAGGETTIQGKRKKVAAASIRVKDTGGLKYGTQFDRLIEWKQGTSSTDPPQYWPGDWPRVPNGVGLTFGDQRLTLDPSFNVTGSICIEQDLPLPASILAIIPEVVMADT